MADPEHLEILKQGVEVWNKWRERNPSIKPNLTGGFIDHLDLQGADLKNARLRDAELKNLVLSSANLQKADLSGVKIINSILDNVLLNDAVLARSDISKTDLRKPSGLSFFLPLDREG